MTDKNDTVTLTRQQAEALLDATANTYGDVESVRKAIREQLKPKRQEPTPGPWEAVNGTDYGDAAVDAHGLRLAKVYGGVEDSVHKGSAMSRETMTNARLIAAAPRYHEWARNFIERGDSTDRWTLREIFNSVYGEKEN